MILSTGQGHCTVMQMVCHTDTHRQRVSTQPPHTRSLSAIVNKPQDVTIEPIVGTQTSQAEPKKCSFSLGRKERGAELPVELQSETKFRPFEQVWGALHVKNGVLYLESKL